ncbi:17388_t:CDS:1, partial [Gigaspora rosea]
NSMENASKYLTQEVTGSDAPYASRYTRVYWKIPRDHEVLLKIPCTSGNFVSANTQLLRIFLLQTSCRERIQARMQKEIPWRMLPNI